MTDQTIRTAAVIGAGTMGGGIAALLAGAGVNTILLDIPAPDSTAADDPARRNQIALNGLERLSNARPPQLNDARDLERIAVGNTEDDFDQLRAVDWVIEAVVERLDIKQALMAKLAGVVRPDAIISTNTSGLLLRDIAAGLPVTFTRRFLGTHFFNPPRQLHLLELIAHPDTDPAVGATMHDFCAGVLGKGVVWCKDTPNFIGNRFFTMLSAQTMAYALDHDFTIAEVDALTGPLIGRPRTATFRLQDLVGLDVAAHIMRNLYPAIPDDEARDILRHDRLNTLLDQLLAKGWLGSKTKQGFYKTVVEDDGSKTYWTLDPDTLDYRLEPAPQFDSVTAHGAREDTSERIRHLISSDDRAGRLLWQHHAFYLAYASRRVPEITETIRNIDHAMQWGFGHELGPFAIWDALGVAATVPQFEAAGYPVAGWVRTMLDRGQTHFYQRDAAGAITAYYSPQNAAMIPVEQR